MRDIYIHIKSGSIPRMRWWDLAVLILFVHAPELGSESATLSTSFPSPTGAYQKLITRGNAYLSYDQTAVGGVYTYKVGFGTTNLPATVGVKALVRSDAAFTGANACARSGYGDVICLGGDGAGSDAEISINAPSSRNKITVYNPMIASRAALHVGNLQTYDGKTIGVNGATPPTGNRFVMDMNGTLEALQPNCASVAYANMAVTSCAGAGYANHYVTNQSGVWSEYASGGPTLAGSGNMICCPCGGACP